MSKHDSLVGAFMRGCQAAIPAKYRNEKIAMAQADVMSLMAEMYSQIPEGTTGIRTSVEFYKAQEKGLEDLNKALATSRPVSMSILAPSEAQDIIRAGYRNMRHVKADNSSSRPVFHLPEKML